MTGAQQRKDWTMTAATASAEARKETPEVDEAEAEAGIVCVLDLGEHRRKRVRKLRKGEGRLMDKVEEAVASLQEQGVRSEEHTSELQSLMRNSYAVFCLKKKTKRDVKQKR